MSEGDQIPLSGSDELNYANMELDVQRERLDDLLIRFGRKGGPTEHGWHVWEPAFHCWLDFFDSRRKRSRQRETKALAIGTLVHEFLAMRYSSEKVLGLVNFLNQHGWEAEVSEALRLYNAYDAFYAPGDGLSSNKCKVVMVEQEMGRDRTPWGLPYTCRADLVCEAPNGYWIVDHKTSSSLTYEFTEGWRTDPAILGLLWCARGQSRDFFPKDLPIVGCVINGVIKTKVPQFQRITFSIDDRIVQAWVDMMVYKFRVEMSIAELKPVPNLKGCFGRYGRCRIYGECLGGTE